MVIWEIPAGGAVRQEPSGPEELNPYPRRDGAKGNAWFVSSGWQKRTAELFTVAGEVDKAAARP